MGIIALANKMKAISLPKLVAEAVSQKTDYIVEVNRLQLRQGEDADEGEEFHFYGSLSYADFKASLSSYKAPLGIPDLFLTGSFQNAMTASVSGNEYKVTSSDKKRAKLEEQYDNIFGINTKKLPLVRAKMDRELIKLFKFKVGLT